MPRPLKDVRGLNGAQPLRRKQEGGDIKAVLRYAEQLLTLAPKDREVQRLVEVLRRQASSQ